MTLTRRAFLKVSAASLGSIVLPLKLRGVRAAPYDLWQGRAIFYGIQTRARPSLEGDKLGMLEWDQVVNITGATVGDSEPAYNRVWYLLDDGSFVHSGLIQPVKTLLNQPLSEVPEGGLLAEVTVPYTRVRWGASSEYGVAYRLYYSSTHWIVRLLVQPDGQTWYRLADDRKRSFYWGLAEHFRPLPPEELRPLHPEVPAEEKRIVVDRSRQVLTAYEGQTPVFQTRTATGAVYSTGDFRTPQGTFRSNRKRASRHMAGGDLAAEDWFDLPGVPWVSYITDGGVAIHGTYWHNDYGRPRSHGCINVTPEAAKWVYRWTLPHVPHDKDIAWEDEGTRVEVI